MFIKGNKWGSFKKSEAHKKKLSESNKGKHSLKEQSPIKIVNTCGCLADEGLVARAILWYSDKFVVEHKTIYGRRNNKYACVTIGDEHVLLHRLIVSYLEKRRLSPTENVHHIDGKGFNNNVENLMLMSHGDHQRLHTRRSYAAGTHPFCKINGETT